MTGSDVAHAWYDIGWVDGLNVAGFVITVVALRLTWRQAKDATTAATAARDAVATTQRQLRGNQLLVIIPQLRWIAAGLDDSIKAGEREMVRKHLENWRWSAANVRGILVSDGTSEGSLLAEVQQSVSLAAIASGVLIEDTVSVVDASREARAAISEACTSLTTWAGTQAASVAQDTRVENEHE